MLLNWKIVCIQLVTTELKVRNAFKALLKKKKEFARKYISGEWMYIIKDPLWQLKVLKPKAKQLWIIRVLIQVVYLLSIQMLTSVIIKQVNCYYINWKPWYNLHKRNPSEIYPPTYTQMWTLSTWLRLVFKYNRFKLS